MGGHVTVEDPASSYFLHGWKGDEDADVDVDISEGSSEGEVEGLRRQAVAVSSGVREPASSKKGRDSAETSAQETSDVGDSAIAKSRAQRGRAIKELEQVPNNISTAAKQVHVKKPVEKPGAVLLPGESSSTRSTSRLHPKRLNDGKRLDARRFRDHFAAKLIGSKKRNTAEGNGSREAGGTPKDKIVPRIPSPRAESKAVKTSSSEQEEGTVTLHVNLEVEQEKDSDFAFNGDLDFGNPQSCKVFTRKRKQLAEGVTKDGENGINDKALDQKKNGLQLVVEKSSDQKNSEDNLQELDTTLDISSKDVNDSGRSSKRARKHNRQTDYIPWSDFGRVSGRKSESSKVEAFAEDAPGTETDSKHNGSKNSTVKESNDANVASNRETKIARQTLDCAGVELNQRELEKDSPTAIDKNDIEKEQITIVDVEKEQITVVQENRITLSHPATVEELEVVHQKSLRPSDGQENTNLRSRELEDAVLQDEAVNECGNASEPPDLLEAELIVGTDMSQDKTGTDRDLDAMEEGTMNEGQSALYEKLLRKEDSRLSMKGGVEKDTVSKSQQAGAEVVKASRDPAVDDHDRAFKVQQAGAEVVEASKGVAVDDLDRAFKIQQAGAEGVEASKGVAADDHDRASKIQQAAVELVLASKGLTLNDHDSVCNKCKREGKLICCDGKNCKVTFHIDCLDPPLSDIPPNDWYCPDCAYKKIVSGMHSVSKGIESIWGVKEGNLDESSLTSKGCSAQEKGELQQGTLCKDGTVSKGLGDKNQGEAEQGLSMLKTVEDTNAQNEPAIESANDTICFLPKSLSSASSAEKMYFVKFKGVAHVHNLWLGESQVLKEAPKLLHTFKKLVEQGKAPQWDPEWAKPFRVIGRRKTMLPSRADLSATCEAEVQLGHFVEWCIKWKKLGYEFCTWELADRMPLKSAYLKKLIEIFQIRSDKAKRRSQSETPCRVDTISKFEVQPEHQSQIEVIQKLTCNWQKHIHSIVVNEMHQDRIRITAGFLLYLLEQCVVTKPCLVVVPASLLAEWKAAFHKWMPTGTVVVYAGSKEARRIIQRYEFYNEEGICMVQIALTSFDTLNLDLEVLKGLNLEAFIIDECQRLRGTKTGKSVRQIGSSYRLLLFSEPFKHMTDDYHSVLALLSNCNDLAGEKDRTSHEDNATLMRLKAAVSKHIVQESKQESSGPKEFWVPIKMTAFQVEEYCKLLVDKCDMLTRIKRGGDIASSPHELLLKIRECCNHPYLVKPSLQESLTNPSAKELLDFGIGASGKLKLLDMMLFEAKSSKKRVVIITRIHLRVNKISLMDILDDYIRQQFGVDSYERLDGGLDKSKKSAAVQRFNALDSKCFVFLLDRRVCGPSIKLRSVNCIVIFDSDWNPQTDIHALQRMHSTGDLKHMAICRFYCPHTVEERVLISARKHSDLDSNYHNFTLGLCHKLLRWGAHKNFELFDSHCRDKDKVNLADELNYSTELVSLFLGKDLSGSIPELCANDPLLKTAFYPRLAGQYNKGPPLFGETNKELIEEETVSSTEFWTDLLKDRLEAPDGQVRELRARKKVQYHEDSFNITNNTKALEEEEESRRKRRRIAESTDFTSVGKSGKHTDRVENLERAHINKSCDIGEKIASQRPKSGAAETAPGLERAHINKSCDIGEKIASQRPKPGAAETAQPQSGLDKVHVNKITSENRVAHDGVESNGVEGTSEPMTGAKSEQQQLLLSMKSDLDKLCQALQFQADTAGHVEQLLFSVGNFFKLPKDRSLLHAIELSLCWLAAEQQHYSIDRHATLALAETCFGVQLDKIDTVYAKLEERWKKRLEQGAQQAPGSRGHDYELSHRGDQDPTSRIPDHELNPLRDKHGLLQAPSNPLSSEDPRMVDSVPNGQEDVTARDASLLKQGSVTSVILEQQQVSVPCETNSDLNNFEIQPSNEQAQAVPGLQDTDELQEPFSDASRVAYSQHQAAINEKQRSERTQALIHAQKTQLRSLDLLENSYKQRLKQHYESALLKLQSSRRASTSELVKLLEGLRSASSILTASIKATRNKLIKKQHEDRGKANKLITSLLERNNAGEAINSCVFENIDIDFSEKSIYDSLPNDLKAVLDTGDFGAIHTTSGSDRINFSSAYAGSILNSNLQAPCGVDHQLASDSGIGPPALLQNQATLDLSESQLRIAPSQQQQRHLQQRQLQDNPSQQGQQQRRATDLVQAQTVVTSGQHEQLWQHTQPQQHRLPVTHPQPVASPVPVPPSPSSPIPLPSQPQSQSQAQPFSRQPQLLPELQQTQPLQGGVAIPPLHAHQQISGSALAHPNETVQPLSTSAAHQQSILHPSSVRGSAASTSGMIRMPQNVPSRTNHQYQNDPLAQEFLRLRKEQEKTKSAHELEKDRIKGQFMKELEVLSKRYEAMLQEEDSLYTQKAAALELNLKKVEMNRRLAEVFRLKNSQDSSLVNTAALVQDVRMLVGASQHTPLMAVRTPLTTQGTVSTSSLPLMPAVAVTSTSMFERPARAPTTSIAGAQLAGTLTDTAWHHSQGQNTITSIGLCPQTANAGSSACPIAGQSRLTMTASGQQSPHFVHEGSRLLASRAATQSPGPMNMSVHRSLPAGISNTPITSVFSASAVQEQDLQTLNLGGNHPTSTQYIEGFLGRIPTTNVQTYATSVTAQCNSTSQVQGDLGSASQTHAGVPQDGYVSWGITMPIPEFTPIASERLACDSIGMEIPRPPFSNNEELQADENRYMTSTSQVNYGLLGQDVLIQTSFHSPTVQIHVNNGLTSTHTGHFDEGRNTAPSDVICLSDDD